MRLRAKYVFTAGLLGLLCLILGAPRAHADTLELTGVGDGANADGVYVSPYQGTISNNGTQIYSGYMICDDFNTESYLWDPWTATSTNAGALNGTEKFTTSLTAYTVQQNYDAVAWLANQLLLPSNLTNAVNQTNYSFAIWDIMDGQTTDPDGGAASLITQAFTQVTVDGYVGSNVTVYTANPLIASQEFLVVNTPEASTMLLLATGLLALVGLGWRRNSQASGPVLS